jgi:hypothetical protein
MREMMGYIPKTTGAGIVAIMLVLVFAFMCVAVVFNVFPESNKDFVILLLNVLSANLGAVAGYLFRSEAAKHPNDKETKE